MKATELTTRLKALTGAKTNHEALAAAEKLVAETRQKSAFLPYGVVVVKDTRNPTGPPAVTFIDRGQISPDHLYALSNSLRDVEAYLINKARQLDREILQKGNGAEPAAEEAPQDEPSAPAMNPPS